MEITGKHAKKCSIGSPFSSTLGNETRNNMCCKKKKSAESNHRTYHASQGGMPALDLIKYAVCGLLHMFFSYVEAGEGAWWIQKNKGGLVILQQHSCALSPS